MIVGRGALDATTSSEDAATTAWVNAVVGAGGSVGATQRGLVDTLIKQYKADGVWSLLGHEWLYASENPTQASIDIVNLAVHTVVPNGSTLTHTANVGYQDAIGGAYIDTGVKPSTAANYAQNSASFGAYILTNRTSGSSMVALGAIDGGGASYSFFRPLTGSNTIEYEVNDGAFPSPANTNAQGSYAFVRSNSSQIIPYKNNAALATGTSTSTTPSTVNFFVFGLNLNGSLNALSTDQIASVFFGGAMNGTQALAKNAALNAYMTSKSINVYS